MTILRYRGEFHPLPEDFSPKTHKVFAGGKPRTDYLIERDTDGRKIVLEGLTYAELCTIEVRAKVTV